MRPQLIPLNCCVRTAVVALLLPARLAVAEAPALPAEREPLKVRALSLNQRLPVFDGQWQGIYCAGDGNVYFGASTHAADHGAALFRYDPATDALKMLADDITALCGSDPKENPHGKLHSDILEDEGRLYFATYYGNPRDHARWPGSHVIGYDIATGAFHDHGMLGPGPGYALYSAIGLDRKRKRLYGFVCPTRGTTGGGELWRLDLRTGERQRIYATATRPHPACMWMFVDRRNDCWFTVRATGGALFRVRSGADHVERWDNALPALHARDRDAPLGDPKLEDLRFWDWAKALPDGNRCAFTLANGGRLWLFDATQPAGTAGMFTPVCHLGATDHGCDLAGGRVYAYERGGHLLSVALDSPRVVNHGRVVDQDGRTPIRVQSLAADGRGRVYMVADVALLPGERDSDKAAVRTYFRKGQDVLERLDRGLFFLIADVAEDIRP